MLAGVFYALVFFTIPQANLPILSGLVGSTVGTMLGLYAGARWGNKKTDDPHPPGATGDVSLTLNASGATTSATVEEEDPKP